MDYDSVMKRNECNNINESENNYAERKKPDKKEYILYDSIHTKFQKRQTDVTESRSVLASGWQLGNGDGQKGEIIKRTGGNFLG